MNKTNNERTENEQSLKSPLLTAVGRTEPYTNESALTVERFAAHSGYDGEKCFVHARAGLTASGEYVMTCQKLLLSGSDIFDGLEECSSSEGRVWTPIKANEKQLPKPQCEGASRMLSVCDFTPSLHKHSGKLLGTGAEICYDTAFAPKKHCGDHLRTAYAVYDEASGGFGEWKTLEVGEKYFENSRAGSTQRYDLDDGTILLPVYFHAPDSERAYSSVVFRCSFDGEHLKLLEIGDEISAETHKRGLYEPSVTRMADGRFLLTMRSDLSAWQAVSDDGLHYTKLVEWLFDDGEILGSYNTQAHFARLGDSTFLVYTRHGANNDHVFRHRAPLFMAEIDPDSLRIKRATETPIVPERGARLGNFGVTQVNDNCVLVTAAEWMQPVGCEKYGSDNTIHCAFVSLK